MAQFKVGDTVRDNGTGYPISGTGEGTVLAVPGDIVQREGSTYYRAFYLVAFPAREWNYAESELELVRAARPAHAGEYDLEFDVDGAVESAFNLGKGTPLPGGKHEGLPDWENDPVPSLPLMVGQSITVSPEGFVRPSLPQEVVAGYMTTRVGW